MSLFLYACTRILNAAICNYYNDVCCAKYMLVSLHSSNRVRPKIEDCWHRKHLRSVRYYMYMNNYCMLTAILPAPS